MKLICQVTHVDWGRILKGEARKVEANKDPTRQNIADFLENVVRALNVLHFNFSKWLSEVLFDDTGEFFTLKVLYVFLLFCENIFSINKDGIKC